MLVLLGTKVIDQESGRVDRIIGKLLFKVKQRKKWRNNFEDSNFLIQPRLPRLIPSIMHQSFLCSSISYRNENKGDDAQDGITLCLFPHFQLEMETERSRPVTPATFHGLCGTTVSSHQFFVEVLLLSEASNKV